MTHSQSSERLTKSEALDSIAVYRKLELERIRQGNYSLAKRIADVTQTNVRNSVMEEIERYKDLKSKHLEQAAKRDPKLSMLYLKLVIHRNEIPSELASRIYGLESFKPMNQIKKYGLEEGITKEEMEEKIWELGLKDYDTSMRREMADQRKSKLMKSKESSQIIETDEDKKHRLEKEEQERQKKREEEAEKLTLRIKAREEERTKRKAVDQYYLRLNLMDPNSYGTPAFPTDLSVHIERVMEPQLVAYTSELLVPWNKLSTRVGISQLE